MLRSGFSAVCARAEFRKAKLANMNKNKEEGNRRDMRFSNPESFLFIKKFQVWLG